MWWIEEDPLLRATTAAVTLLDRAPRREVLTERLERATRDLPRLRQRVVGLPRAISTPIWRDDPHFRLGDHLRTVRAARDGGFRAVLDHAAALAMQGFDRARPLWEFVVVEDLEDGRAAVIQKLHHAVTDGVGGMLLMQRVYDRGPDEPFAYPPVPVPAREPSALEIGGESLLRTATAPLSWLRRGVGALPELAADPLGGARAAARGLASLLHVAAPGRAPLSPLMRERSTRYRFDTLSVPLAGLRAAAHGAGCKLNDAFVAALAGGFRRYHERHGARVAELRASIPINLRGPGAGGLAGNRMLPARLRIPLRDRDPRRRMRRVRRLVAAEREQPALAWIEELSGAARFLPRFAVRELVGRAARHVDFVAACVPGLPVELWMAGARVESLHTFGPTAGSAANVTLFSYLDRAGVALNTDRAAVPDPEVLLECLGEGFDEVLKTG
jgi:WS/DGAT/MGAT family acyltransferase